jgi:hypothetical protein
VDQPIHVVDVYPTLTRLAGAPLGKNKPLDGIDVRPTLSEGKPSPREEVVYDIEPFRAAVRKGTWKPVWQATLPSRIEALAREAAPPLILEGGARRGEAGALRVGYLAGRGAGSRKAAVSGRSQCGERGRGAAGGARLTGLDSAQRPRPAFRASSCSLVNSARYRRSGGTLRTSA